MKQRGLVFSNENMASYFLDTIGYYRLSAYIHPFLRTPKRNHLFHRNVSFDNIISIYRFDKKLRMLVLNEIEKIEVGIRAAIVSEGTDYFRNPYWMTQRSSYRSQIPGGFRNMISKIKNEFDRSSEDFVKHFKLEYTNSFPPAWILSETLSFGCLTYMFNNLRPAIKTRLAQKFNLSIAPFESWIGIIHLTRNICCHHSRLWNRWNAMQPSIPNSNTPAWIASINNHRSLYFNLCIIKHFVDILSPSNDMAIKLRSLMDSFPIIWPGAMGFPDNWRIEAIWQ